MPDDRPVVVAWVTRQASGKILWLGGITGPLFLHFVLDDPDRQPAFRCCGIECPIAEIDYADDTAKMFKDALPVMRLAAPSTPCPATIAPTARW